jgi:hypothetical protein
MFALRLDEFSYAADGDNGLLPSSAGAGLRLLKARYGMVHEEDVEVIIQDFTT